MLSPAKLWCSDSQGLPILPRLEGPLLCKLQAPTWKADLLGLSHLGSLGLKAAGVGEHCKSPSCDAAQCVPGQVHIYSADTPLGFTLCQARH